MFALFVYFALIFLFGLISGHIGSQYISYKNLWFIWYHRLFFTYIEIKWNLTKLYLSKQYKKILEYESILPYSWCRNDLYQKQVQKSMDDVKIQESECVSQIKIGLKQRQPLKRPSKDLLTEKV
jgi:hypothetical protein